MGLLFSYTATTYSGKRNPLQQLVAVPGPIVGGRGNLFAGGRTAEPSQLLTGILYRVPVSSILPPPHPPQRSLLSFHSPLLFCLPQHSHLPLLHFVCLIPHCSAAFSAQNNFCSGNSSPSLSTFLQYFSLAFALGDVVEHYPKHHLSLVICSRLDDFKALLQKHLVAKPEH